MDRPVNALQLCRWQFSHKLCSTLSSSEVYFYTGTTKLSPLRLPLGGLGANVGCSSYRLIGKLLLSISSHSMADITPSILYQIWAKSNNPRRSYCDFSIWPYDLQHVSCVPPYCGIICRKSVNLSVRAVLRFFDADTLCNAVTLTFDPLTLKVCGTSRVEFLAAAGYPDPPNFGMPPKIRRKKCGCRKRRRILESRSAAEKNPAKIRLNMFPTLTKLAQLHLSSSAASVPVECTFSAAVLVANDKRSNLSAWNFIVVVSCVTITSCFSDRDIDIIDCIITTAITLHSKSAGTAEQDCRNGL